MSRLRLIVKIATVAGPAAYNLIKTYGPQLKQMADENPQLVDAIKSRFGKVIGAGRGKEGKASLEERIEVLRDQVTYLYASANSPRDAENAATWRRELDAIEKVLPVLGAMSTSARKEKAAEIDAQLDELSAKILSATLKDKVEDAEIVDDEN